MADAKATKKDEAPAGAKEVQDAFEEAQERGYFGVEVDPTPNKEFSVQSGPDSPTAEEQREAVRSRSNG